MSTTALTKVGTKNAEQVVLLDASGNQVTSFGGGTQYEDGTASASPTGTAIAFDDGGTIKVVSSAEPLPVLASIDTTGLATSANQATIIGHVDGIETLLGTIDADTSDIHTNSDTIAAGFASEGAALGSGVLLQGDDGTDRKNINVDATTGDVQVDVTNTVTVDGSGVTQPISAASLPLPSGAATAANQQTDALTDTQLRATAVPVSGTVTAELSAVDNAVLDTIDAVLDTIKTDTAAMVTDLAAVEVLLTGIDADTNDIKTSVQLIDNIVGSIAGAGSPTIDSYQQVAINLAAGANQLLVSSAANKQIWVYGYHFMVNAAGTVSFQDEDDTALTGVMPFAANGGATIHPSGNFAMPIWKLATDKDLEVDLVTAELDGYLCYSIVSV
jgi:hypothetical protein